jgi:hypothetical protein
MYHKRDTLLYLAARRYDQELLKALVDLGSNLTTLNDEYLTPFDEAVLDGKLNNATWFLENGVPFSALDQVLEQTDAVPEFEMCNMLWEKYPKEPSRMTAYILIFSAVFGIDGLPAKVDEISRHYDDVTPILEEAICIAMELLHDYDSALSFHTYYESLHSSDYDGSSDERQNYLYLAEGDVLHDFLEYGVDPNAGSVTDHPSPIVSAIKFWTAEEVKALLDHGATMDQR